MWYFSNIQYCFKHELPKDCQISEDKSHLMVCKECAKDRKESTLEANQASDLREAEDLYNGAI